jgi:hypothetical protein
MTEAVTRTWLWKPGQSGNPKGRPPKNRVLTEMLRERAQDVLTIGGQEMPAQEAVARAVWQLVTTGEVWLAGKRLEAESVSEWAAVVKWLYTYVEPPKARDDAAEHEMIVHVVREPRPSLQYHETSDAELEAALETDPLP